MSIALSACSEAPTLPSPDIPDLASRTEAVAEPEPKCAWPNPQKLVHEGSEYVAFDAAGLAALTACRISETSNHDIAAANADTARAYQGAMNRLVDALEDQRHQGNYLLEREHEGRRDSWVEAQAYKAAMLLVAIAAVL